MDHLKPPSRLNVVLLSLPPRTQAVLDYFFSSTGRSSFAVTDPELAHAAIFDVDTLASRQHWDAWHAGTGRPGIAMSIQPQELPGTVWVRKPITPAALLHAAAELGAMRWQPMQQAAAPAAPVTAPAMSPVAAPVASPLVAEVSAAEVVAEVVAPAVVPSPSPDPTPAPIVPAAEVVPQPDVEAPAERAPEPARVPPIVEPHAPVVATPEVPVAATAAAAANAAVAAPSASPDTTPVMPAPVLPTDKPTDKPVDKPAEPPVMAQPRPAAPVEPVQDRQQAARPAGIGGFLKRLFGAATVPASAPAPLPAQAAARPAVARATYPTGNPASNPAVRAQVSVSPLGRAAAVEPPAPDAVVLGTSPGATTAPAAATVAAGPRPVVVPLNKTHVRKRGRKGPTRWVDPNGGVEPGLRDGVSADAAQDAQADDEQDDRDDRDGRDHVDQVDERGDAVVAAEPATRTATPAANDDADRPAADAAASVITLEAEPVVRIEPYASEAQPALAANADRGDDAAEAAVASAGPAVVWRGLSSPTDQADEALYCGNRPDAPIEVLQSDRSLRHDPSQSLVAALTEAYLIGRKWQVPTQFEFSGGRVIVDSPRNRVLLGFDDARLAEVLARGPERIKTLALNRHEQAALQLREGENWQPLDRLLWRAGLLQSQGRLPVGVDLKRPVYLKHWPNLTRVQRTPHAMRVAALWATRGAGLVETAELLKIPQRHVFAFYSAALAADLVTEDGSSVKRAQRRGARNRGLLTRLLGWLQA